jgi:hypothetical protein
MKLGIWNALDRLAAGLTPAAVLAEWSGLADGEFPAIQPYLRVTDRLAAVYPCLGERDCGCLHEVEPEYLYARCDCGDCEPVKLEPTDLIVHELDVARFGGAMAGILGFERADMTTVFHAAPKCWPVGIHAATRSPVYLAICVNESQLLANLEGLANARREPFILLVPTANARSEIIGQWLGRQRCAFIPLASHVAVEGRGQFRVTNPIQPILDRFAAGLPSGQKTIAVEKPTKRIASGEVGRLRWDNDFEDIWVGGVHYDLSTRDAARYCIRYLVMMKAFDKATARHLEKEINEYVRKQMKRDVLKPGSDGNLRIQHYFSGSGKNYQGLRKELVKSAGRNGCFYLQVT